MPSCIPGVETRSFKKTRFLHRLVFEILFVCFACFAGEELIFLGESLSLAKGIDTLLIVLGIVLIL